MPQPTKPPEGYETWVDWLVAPDRVAAVASRAYARAELAALREKRDMACVMVGHLTDEKLGLVVDLDRALEERDALRARADALADAVDELLAHPSDHALDATWTEDGKWFLPPLGHSERKARAALRAYRGTDDTAE